MESAANGSAEQLTSSHGLPIGSGFSAEGLLDSLPWAVLVLDEQHRIQRINQQAERWCGASPKRLLGQLLTEAAVPPAVRATLVQLLELGEVEPREVYLPQQEQWIAFSATRQPSGWVLYGQDITPQKRREQQYQALAENTPDVLTRWGPDLRLRYANAAFADKSGTSLFELLGRTNREMGQPEHIAGPYMAVLQRVFDTGRLQEYFNSFPTPHGEVHYYSRLVPELREGRIETVLGIARDITALKQNEAVTLQLRDELARRTADHYHALFHRMDQAFCVLELLFDDTGQTVVDCLYRQVNPVFSRQSGLSGDVVGRSGRDVMPDLETFWFDIYGRVARTGESERLEQYVPPVDRWFDVHTFRVGGPGSREVGVLFQDITARKQQELHQTFLLRFSDALRAETSATGVAHRALGLLGEQLQLDRCYIGLYDQAGDRATFPHQVGNDRIPPVPAEVRLSDFPDALRVAHDRTLVIDDLAQADGLSDTDRHNLGALGLQALVAATLRRGANGPQWAIVALSADVRHWTPGEVALLEEATERTWAAMEHMRADAALRQSEEEFRLLVTTTSDTVYRLSADCTQLEQLLGHDFLADTLSPSRTWTTKYIPDEDLPLVQAAIADAIARKGPLELEHRVQQADGTVGWAHTRAVPVLDAQGEVTSWLGAATNITARKQAEEALRQSEQRQRTLIANLPGAAVFVVDRDLRYQLAEGEALRQVGDDPADYLGRTVQEMAPPDQWPAYRTLYEGALAGQAFEREHDQGGRRFLTRGVPLPGPDGGVPAVLAVSYDITERQQAEEALRVSQATLAAVFEALPVGVGVADAQGQFTLANHQMQQYLPTGRMPSLDDTQHTRWRGHHPDGRPLARREFPGARALRGESVVPGVEMRYMPDEGPDCWTQVFCVPLPDGRGEVSGQVTVILDITARKAAEEALRQAEESHRAELEQQVAERTQELQESRDLLHAIAESQSAFISAFKAVRDAHGRVVDLEYVFTNTRTQQIAGGRPLVGRRYLEVFPEAENAGFLASFRRVLETGVGEDRELPYHDDQLTGWYRSNATKLDDGVLVVGEDITPRKQTEQERARLLHLLEQAEAVAGLGSWDYDLLSKEFLWSEGMYRLFGLPPGQPVRPDVYLQYVVDEDRPHAERLVHCLTTGTDCFEDTLRLRVGEQVKTVRIKSVVLYNEAGAPVRVLGVDLDISQLQRLEADNLRLRLTQQRALFEAVQAAQEAERKRMAESLHNGIGQMLFATKLRLDQLHAPLLGTNAALVAARNEADRLLSEAIRQTRALSHELVPMALEKFGLAASLRDIGSDMSTPQLRFRCQVVVDEDAALLPSALQTALYRMAQELAQNIVKHAAGATEASLELETTPGWALLRAEDNGAGFAAPRADAPGLGLRSIRDRVALLGGQFETGTRPTSGAFVRIRIPLPAAPPHATPVPR